MRRRRLILLTALRLFAEKGFERTTIADIADAAEVAPRTVSGYFPSKLDFITEWPANRSRRLLELFEANPDASFTDLLDRFWRDARDNLDPEEAALTRAMALANPGVAAMAEVAVSQREEREVLKLPGDTELGGTIQDAGRAAINGVNQAYFIGLAEQQMTDDLHDELLDLVRTIAAATGSGHGALRPGR
jgi:AcrR family transcriptional regulator